MKEIKGIVGYLVTPYTPNGVEVDNKKIELLVDMLIDRGVHAIAPLGSTGESAYLSMDEWSQVAEATINKTAGRVPTVIGVSALTTKATIKMAKKAELLGADAVMVLPLSYWKLSEKEIFSHYASISDALNIPIMAYNNPATAGVDMMPELLVKMVKEIDNVKMVKESSGDIQRMHDLYTMSNGELPFFNGCNPLALEAFAAGASGWCTAAPNLIAEENLTLWNAVERGDMNSARTVFYKQLPILQFILKGGLPSTIKAALRIQGVEVGDPRLPLMPLDEKGQAELKYLMNSLSLIQ